MKKILFFLIASFLSLASFSQIVVENPQFSATTIKNVNITKVILYDTVTAVEFKANYIPHHGFWGPSKNTYIQNSQGGEKLFLKRAEGIPLDSLTTPESGNKVYTLFFPPVDKSAESIDFLQGHWKIFDIELKPQEHFSVVPTAIHGNWLRTDGSNDWEYGFYDNMVIYENDFWKQVLIHNKGKKYEVHLQKDDKQEVLYLKLAKKGKLLIGLSPDNLELYSQERTENPDFVLQNDEAFTQPVFKMDTAVYKGYIKGYHTKMGTTGMVYANNVISGEQDSHLITINPDGTFEAKVPMLYPQQVFIRMTGIKETVFLEPGKTTFSYSYLPAYTAFNKVKSEKKYLFMGDGARINNDLQLVEGINYFNYNETKKKVLDMTAEDYKAYLLSIMEREQKALSTYAENHVISRKALQIKQMQIEYRTYTEILSFNFIKEYAYRQKHDIPRQQREIPLEKEELSPEYYDFVHADDLNNPFSILTGGTYSTYINRIMFADVVRPKERLQPPFMFKYLPDKFDSYQIELSAQEQALVLKLTNCETSECTKEVYIQEDSVFAAKFFETYQEIVNEAVSQVYEEAFEEFSNNAFEKYFGLGDGFARDLMYAQSKHGRMEGRIEPFSDSEKATIKDKISDPFIEDFLILASDTKQNEINQKLAENRGKSGYVVNETPKTKGDELFDTIMEKYKGKVVFVDFWATWCGPCRSGMEKMKPLKEELKNEDIEFVYITNHSSPVDKWNLLIPDIKGEHYRVTQDEWNFFSSRFNISGIPHYLLVDENGKVVEDKIYFASSNDSLKRMLEKYMEK